MASRFAVASCTLLSALWPGCSPAKPETTAAPKVTARPSVDADVANPDGSDAAGGADSHPADADAAPRMIVGCHAVTCLDQLELRVTLPIPASELANANVALEIGDETVPVHMPIPLDRTSGWGWRGEGGAYRNTDLRVLSLSPAFSQLRIEVVVAEGLPSGGTTFSLKVDTPTRGTVLDLTRTLIATVREVHPAGPACGVPCKDATARLYAGSVTGRTCGSQQCRAGLELHVFGPELTSRLNNAIAHVCRNQHCAEVKLDGMFNDGWQNSDVYHERHAGFAAPLFPSELVADPRAPNSVVVYVTTDPVVLATGDRYTVTFRKNGRVLGKFETTVVSYDASYPNGPVCDLVPCLRKMLTTTM